MKRSIFKEGKRYTFSDYFDMNHPTEEIVAALGYVLILAELELPQQTFPQAVSDRLRASYYELLPKITLTSEIAKRECIIAPVLHEVIRPLDAKLNIEYPIEVDDKLSGTIDYLIRAAQELVIIEAKRGDLDRGFTQLAAELIAVDQYEEPERCALLYGVITIGEVWRFAVLDRQAKVLRKSIHALRFPEELEEIVNILTGILTQGKAV
jgi:hypothetical protein